MGGLGLGCAVPVRRLGNGWGCPPPPPPFPMAVVQTAERENSLAICSYLGVREEVRKWVAGHFRVPEEKVRVLRERFEGDVKQFQAAEPRARGVCGGKRGTPRPAGEGEEVAGHCRCA